MITLIILMTIYFISVYHSLKFTKYLFRLYDMDMNLIDLLTCFVPISNTFTMIWYLIIKNCSK